MLAVMAAMRELGRESLRMREAVAALDDAAYDGATTVQEAIAHGVLTADDEGSLSFGVPSFRRHMVQRLERDRRMSAASGSAFAAAGPALCSSAVPA